VTETNALANALLDFKHERFAASELSAARASRMDLARPQSMSVQHGDRPA
jgi:hypothetical protein